jgi:type II secretory pathway pseudopilin PulG
MIRLARLARSLRRSPGEDGFSLIEGIVGLFILGILATAILSLLFTTYRVQNTTRARLLCNGFAQQQLEAIKSWEWVSFRNIADYGGRYDADPVTVGPFTIYRTVFVSWATEPGNPAITDVTNPGLTSLDYFRVEVVCTWNEMGAAAPVRFVTYIKPLDCDPNSGYLIVNVRDHLNAPLPGQNPPVNFTLFSWTEGSVYPFAPAYDAVNHQWQYGCLPQGNYEITATFSGAYYDANNTLLYQGPWIGKDGRFAASQRGINIQIKNKTEITLNLAPPADLAVEVRDDDGDLITTTVAASAARQGTNDTRVVSGNNPLSFTQPRPPALPLWPDTYDIVATAYDCDSGGGMLARTGIITSYVVRPGNNNLVIPVVPTGNLTMNVTVTRRSDDTAVRAQVSARNACGTITNLGTTNSQGQLSRSGMQAGLYLVEATTTAAPILRGSTWVVAASNPTGVGVSVG